MHERNLKQRFSLLCFSFLFCLISFSAAQAATLRVPEDYSTIQSGIDAAVNGDTVLVNDGTYVENINFKGKAITVRSVNGPSATIIDGNNGRRVVMFNSNEIQSSVIDGFTITNGETGITCYSTSPTITNCIIKGNYLTSPSTDGGGIYSYGGSGILLTNSTIIDNSATSRGGGLYIGSSSPTLRNCIISGNNAGSEGGGLYFEASITMESCTITGNYAQSHGGGVYVDSGARPSLISNCIITGNSTDQSGGGIVSFNSKLTISGCSIIQNIAKFNGGGIYDESPSNYSVTITNSIIKRNTANLGKGGGIHGFYSLTTIDGCLIAENTVANNGWGGGLFFDWSHPVITNCVIIRNSAYRGGGLAFNDNSPSTITNSTISENIAQDIGGGLYDYNSPVVDVINCILWNNSAPNGAEIGNWSGYPQVTYSDIKGGLVGEGNINVDPMFMDVLNDDYHLTNYSPCIDAGDPDLDGDGLEWQNDHDDQDPDGSRLDMGAFYFDHNLVKNFSFEIDSGIDFYPDSGIDDAIANNNIPDGWSAGYGVLDSAAAYEGSKSLKISVINNRGYSVQDIPIEQGKIYDVSGYVKTDCSDNNCYGTILTECMDASHTNIWGFSNCKLNTKPEAITRLYADNDWTKIEYKVQSDNPNAQFLRAICYNTPNPLPAGTGDVWCDAMSVKEVSNTNSSPVLNPIGNKYVYADNTLRFSISGIDPDNDTLTYSASNLPSGATFNQVTRTFNWVPTAAGTYSGITFTVTDGLDSDSEAITITVKSKGGKYYIEGR